MKRRAARSTCRQSRRTLGCAGLPELVLPPLDSVFGATFVVDCPFDGVPDFLAQHPGLGHVKVRPRRAQFFSNVLPVGPALESVSFGHCKDFKVNGASRRSLENTTSCEIEILPFRGVRIDGAGLPRNFL